MSAAARVLALLREARSWVLLAAAGLLVVWGVGCWRDWRREEPRRPEPIPGRVDPGVPAGAAGAPRRPVLAGPLAVLDLSRAELEAAAARYGLVLAPAGGPPGAPGARYGPIGAGGGPGPAPEGDRPSQGRPAARTGPETGPDAPRGPATGRSGPGAAQGPPLRGSAAPGPPGGPDGAPDGPWLLVEERFCHEPGGGGGGGGDCPATSAAVDVSAWLLAPGEPVDLRAVWRDRAREPRPEAAAVRLLGRWRAFVGLGGVVASVEDGRGERVTLGEPALVGGALFDGVRLGPTTLGGLAVGGLDRSGNAIGLAGVGVSW